MPRPYTLLERVDTAEGALELRQSGEQNFIITIAGRVLMSSMLHRSEVAVAELGIAPIRSRAQARVLIGGLGLGYTLRAALDALPRTARVMVAELNPVVERWCRGPLSVLTRAAVEDRRVRVVLGDVTEQIAEAAETQPYDAIVLDLYVGPGNLPKGRVDPLYGSAILAQTYAALTPGGVYAVWSEEPNPRFEERLRKVGFRVELLRTHGGGPRHAVYVAVKPADKKSADTKSASTKSASAKSASTKSASARSASTKSTPESARTQSTGTKFASAKLTNKARVRKR